jgi:outer membrane protein TolC
MFAFCGRAPVYIICIALTAWPWTPTAFAQQRVPLTIAEAEDLAVASEPGLDALLARADAMQERAVAAGQLPDPMLRVGLANFPIESGGFSTEGMTQAQLGLRQVFPRAREHSAAEKRAMGDAFDHGADARRRDVLSAVRKAWLDVYLAEQAGVLVTESRPFFADLVTITRSLYGVGRMSQHDVLRAELELSRLDDRLIDIGRTRSEAQAALSRWIGEAAYRPLAMKFPKWETLPALEELRAELAVHPLLEAADAGIVASNAAVRVAEESKKPGWAVDLGYGYREGFLPNGDPRSDMVSLSVTVHLPFFSDNRQDRKLAAALGERRAATNSQAALRARLGSELDAEYARWTDLTRRLELYDKRILGQSQGQAQAALLAYQSNAGDFADVMRAWIDNLDTRLQRIELQVKRAQSYAVLANLGGLEQ